MTPEALKGRNRVIGIKQVTKSVKRGLAASVILAEDADEKVLRPLTELCEANDVPVSYAKTMQELGKACGIEVGAAAAAISKTTES